MALALRGGAAGGGGGGGAIVGEGARSAFAPPDGGEYEEGGACADGGEGASAMRSSPAGVVLVVDVIASSVSPDALAAVAGVGSGALATRGAAPAQAPRKSGISGSVVATKCVRIEGLRRPPKRSPRARPYTLCQ
jgi:hypothetical protein